MAKKTYSSDDHSAEAWQAREDPAGVHPQRRAGPRGPARDAQQGRRRRDGPRDRQARAGLSARARRAALVRAAKREEGRTMRFGISFNVGRRSRVGVSVGGGRRPRLWARERITRGVYLTESTSVGKKRRRTR